MFFKLKHTELGSASQNLKQSKTRANSDTCVATRGVPHPQRPVRESKNFNIYLLGRWQTKDSLSALNTQLKRFSYTTGGRGNHMVYRNDGTM